MYSQFVSTVPFVFTDPGSFTGSGTHAATYEFALKNSEKDTKKEIKEYNEQYNRRMKYYLLTLGNGIVTKIDNKIKKVLNRLDILEEKNKKLSFLNYSRKKKSRNELRSLKTMLNNIRNNYQNKHIGSIYGEKLNLYENLMKSLTKINRMLDEVERDIDKSFYFNRLKSSVVK